MGNQRPDVIVVGGGIIGSSIAWRLAQKGVKVQLRDAGLLGGGTSSAGAGMLAPGGEISGPSALASLLIESRSLYPAFVQELSESTGIAIDYNECGAIESAANEMEWTALLARADAQSALGIVSEQFGHASRFYPGDAVVDPLDVLRALRIACTINNVDIREHSPVDRLDTLDAQAIVLAAGAWSSSIPGLPASIPAVFPVKGHLIGYDLRPGSIGPIRRRGQTYLLQRRSGFAIAGSTTEERGFDTSVDPAMVQDIRRRAESLFPPLQGLSPVRHWAGVRPGTANHEPAIGPVAGTRLWLAYGHYRNGILAAPATASRIADGVTSSLEMASLVLPNRL